MGAAIKAANQCGSPPSKAIKLTEKITERRKNWKKPSLTITVLAFAFSSGVISHQYFFPELNFWPQLGQVINGSPIGSNAITPTNLMPSVVLQLGQDIFVPTSIISPHINKYHRTILTISLTWLELTKLLSKFIRLALQTNCRVVNFRQFRQV